MFPSLYPLHDLRLQDWLEHSAEDKVQIPSISPQASTRFCWGNTLDRILESQEALDAGDRGEQMWRARGSGSGGRVTHVTAMHPDAQVSNAITELYPTTVGLCTLLCCEL